MGLFILESGEWGTFPSYFFFHWRGRVSFVPLPAFDAHGEHWFADLTGSESAVSSRFGARYLLLTDPVVGGSGRAQGKITSVQRGGPCPATNVGFVKLFVSNYAGYLPGAWKRCVEFPNRTVEV